MWLAATNGFSLGWDSLQPEAPPERRRVAGQAPALSPQQPPRERAGCERIAVVLVHAVPCNVRGAITGGRSCVDCPRNCSLCLRQPEDHPFTCCRGSGESWRAICCLESSAHQDAHRSPGALIRRSLLCFRARRSRELPCRSMKHGPSARGTEAERRGDCRSAATGPIILAEHDLFRAKGGKSRKMYSLGGNREGVTARPTGAPTTSTLPAAKNA